MQTQLTCYVYVRIYSYTYVKLTYRNYKNNNTIITTESIAKNKYNK